MSESLHEHDASAASDQSEPQPTPQVESTGHEEVDAVVASMSGLDDLPVAEHVAVFEQAHESLRRTLAGAGQDSPAAVGS